MMIYFADRGMNILGHAATNLKKGFTIIDDVKAEDVETGVATFECEIEFDADNRLELEAMTEAGNYLLRSANSENEFYTIIETEIDTKNQTVRVYAEDAGLDLLNEVVGEYEATEAHTAEWYVNKFSADSGFEIGINEIPEDRTRTLSWEGESTATERLASIATQFGGFEVSYSFAIMGMEITHKYINIHEIRGKDIGVTLRLNKDIDRIVTKKSVANLATALRCTGGTPEGEEKPITLKGYEYDDGDFYVDGVYLKSRNALEKWSRYQWETLKPAGYQGHIVKQFSYETTNQKTLCSHALTELKKICDMEVNYEIDITKLPDNVGIGDRVNIVDDGGELYLSTRILNLEASETGGYHTATLGEHIIKTGGISQKVEEMAERFAEQARSAAKALVIAEQAHLTAEGALEQVEDAMASVEDANAAVQDAVESIDAAKQAAQEANAAAEAAQNIVDHIDERVDGLEATIDNAEEAIQQAQDAADTADAKAVEAKQAAVNAQAKADETAAATATAQSTADTAITKAESARLMADSAEGLAAQATWTADAAKADAAAAVTEVNTLSKSLTSLESTMAADYAKKTDLTETEASLQTQITQNAGQISSTASKLLTVDETANNAQELAAQAQTEAQAAQKTADDATADAKKAQDAADTAQAAANAAQSEADTAKAAAKTAQDAADEADAKVQAAKADLATVTGRVDATEEEIAAAQQAVINAQAAADKAQDDANTAEEKAIAAQNKANTAYTDAANAQTSADNAAKAAKTAQDTANKAVGDAAAAQTKANEAASAAATAQATANTAKTNAATAQAKADQAYSDAVAAQKAADDADAKAQTAANNLATAEANLAAVTSRVGATEEEIEAAKADVVKAKQAADAAQSDADTAQATANTAKANAATAQTAANNAKAAADKAQEDADAAKEAADKAQEDVNALAVRVTSAETKITQNSEQIALRATKTEVATTLGGYYTKAQADAAISVKADEITQSVSATYTTKEDFQDLTIGGRNLLLESASQPSAVGKTIKSWGNQGGNVVFVKNYKNNFDAAHVTKQWSGVGVYLNPYIDDFKVGDEVTLSIEVHNTLNENKSLWFYLMQHDSAGNRVFVADVDHAELEKLLAGETKRISYTHKIDQATIDLINSGGTARLTIQVTNTVNDAYFYAPKLEKGSKATDYTPAAEDINARVETAETRITQTEESITAHAQTMTDYGTRIGDLEVSDQEITLSVSNVKKTADAAKKQKWHEASGTSGTTGYVGICQFVINGTYTNRPIRLSLRNRGTNASDVDIRFANANSKDPGLDTIRENGDIGVWIVKTATSTWEVIAKKSEGYDTVYVTDYENNNTGIAVTWNNIHYSSLPTSNITQASKLIGSALASTIATKAELKVEQDRITANVSATNGLTSRMSTVEQTASGLTVSLSETQADVETAQSTANTAKTNAATAQSTANTARTEAANAAKTATNFMSYDATNGLQIGNKTSGSWSGNRAQVKSSAFNVLDSSGTQLASFGTTATIGKTSSQNVYIDSSSLSIRNNGTTWAKFQAKQIDLGMNATDAVINVCGGAGTIKQATITVGANSISSLTVQGANATLYGTTSAVLLASGGFVQADADKVWIYSSTSSANAEIRVEPTEVSLLANTMLVTGRNSLTVDGMQGVTLKNSLAGNVNVTATVGNLNATASAGYLNISSKHDATITSTDGAVIVDAYDGFSVNSLYGTVGLTAGNGAVAIASTVNNVNLSAANGAVNINAKYGALFPKGDGVGVNFGDYVSALHMDSSGNIGVGKGLQTSGANLWLYGKNINVDATTATYLRINGTNAARLYLSDSLYILRPETDGGATLGTTGVRWNAVNAKILRTYDTSTTSNGVAARVYDNRIYRYSSSSRRYKHDIAPITAEEIAPERLYDAEVVQFKYNEGYLIDEDVRCNKLIPGFIVEKLAEAYPIAIDYNEDGTPEMWNANILIPPMLKLIQDLHAELEEIKTKLA